MANQINNPKAKKLSKGQRIHARRVKQAARKEGPINDAHRPVTQRRS